MFENVFIDFRMQILAKSQKLFPKEGCGNLVFTINSMYNKKQIKSTVSSDLVSLNFMLWVQINVWNVWLFSVNISWKYASIHKHNCYWDDFYYLPTFAWGVSMVHTLHTCHPSTLMRMLNLENINGGDGISAKVIERRISAW